MKTNEASREFEEEDERLWKATEEDRMYGTLSYNLDTIVYLTKSFQNNPKCT
jgi:hypothetical protein